MEIFTNRVKGNVNGTIINGDYNVTNIGIPYDDALASFFGLFSHGGIAYKCVWYLAKKYDLAHIKGFYGTLTSDQSKYFDESLPQLIIQDKDVLDVDFAHIFKEVNDNILHHTNLENKENYAKELLRPFVDFLNAVKPNSQRIANMEERNDEIEKGFKGILHGEYAKDSVEDVFKKVFLCLDSYSDWLELTLLKHGVSLFFIQDDMGIYLTDRSRHHPHRYTQWTSETDAKHLIEDLDNKYSKYK